MAYRIEPGERLDKALARIAREEIGKALVQLTDPALDRREAIHEARRRFKLIRGLFLLVRPADRDFARREMRRYRALGHLLAPHREAGQLVETLDATLAGDATATARFAKLRQKLARREAGEDRAGVDAAMQRAAAQCRKGLKALDDLPRIGRRQAAAIVEDAVGRTARRGAVALGRAKKRGRPADFHALRRHVKYHFMQVKLLQSAWPGPMRARRRAARRLSDDLGAVHDIAVMQARMDAEPRAFGSRAEIAALSEALRKRRKRLERQSLGAATRLFGEEPEALAARIGLYLRQATKEARRKRKRASRRVTASIRKA